MTDAAKFEKIYERERVKIDRELHKIFREKKPLSLYQPASYILTLPGKRLRPFLVLLTANVCGKKFSEVYRAALALEMMHTFTLVHDDIMDNADKRRGSDTLHKKYDLSTAILSGDGLLSIAYNYLIKDANVNTRTVIAEFTNGLIEVCEGQSLDKEFETRSKVSLDEYLTMIDKKTAIMIETCCAIGSLLAGADAGTVKTLKKFGKNLGMAFQIQDDLLDVIGEEKEFGKKIGGDLIEGKKTFLFLDALAKAKGKDLLDLKKVITNKGIKSDEVAHYRAIYERVGTFESAKKKIKFYSDKAEKCLKQLPDSGEMNILVWLTDKLIKRKY